MHRQGVRAAALRWPIDDGGHTRDGFLQESDRAAGSEGDERITEYNRRRREGVRPSAGLLINRGLSSMPGQQRFINRLYNYIVNLEITNDGNIQTSRSFFRIIYLFNLALYIFFYFCRNLKMAKIVY